MTISISLRPFQGEIILKNKFDPTKAISSHGMKDKKLIHISQKLYHAKS